MDGIQLGPIVISAPRFYALLGLVVLVLLAELLARRNRTDAAWAWNAAFAVIIGARLGFVVENLGFYLADPIGIIRIWQGGFSPWWGVAAGALTAVWASYRTRINPIAPAVAALAVWLVVPATVARLDDRVITLPEGAHQRLTGQALEFEAQPGAPVVLNVWATWCGPCQRELPHLAQAALDWPDVEIYYLNQGESAERINSYLDDHPDLERDNVLLDPGQRTGRSMGSFGLPTTFFFAADGSHVHTQIGEISGPALNRQIERIATPGLRSDAP